MRVRTQWRTLTAVTPCPPIINYIIRNSPNHSREHAAFDNRSVHKAAHITNDLIGVKKMEFRNALVL
jgi:hypothetical protein